VDIYTWASGAIHNFDWDVGISLANYSFITRGMVKRARSHAEIMSCIMQIVFLVAIPDRFFLKKQTQKCNTYMLESMQAKCYTTELPRIFAKLSPSSVKQRFPFIGIV